MTHGGRVLKETRLDDDVHDPQPEMLRRAPEQSGPRITQFAQAGTIKLLDELTVREPFVTMEGSDAPGDGVCIRGGCLKFSGPHNVIIRELRVRLGDEQAFPLDASVSTLSVHHCLSAHFVMRGPPLECNDLGKHDDYTVKMEAVNNVVFDYTRSGARYSCGVEKGLGQARDRWCQFQFLNKDASKPEIEVITKHGFVPVTRVCIAGNKADTHWWGASTGATQNVLEQVGCTHRDSVDKRILCDVAEMRYGKVIRSKSAVGG